MLPFCEQSPVLCSAGQYTRGCRGEDCTELNRVRKANWRANGGEERVAQRKRAFDRWGIRYPGDRDLAWRDDAKCLGVPQHVFFPGVGEQYVEARTYCCTCPVAKKCLDFALVNECTEGMFGGLTPRERRRVKKDGRAA